MIQAMEARSAQEIWEAALGELQIEVSKPNYRTWLQKTTGLSYQDNQFVIGVPSPFVAEYLDKNQRSLIESTLIGLTRHDIKVIFHINGKNHHSSNSHGTQDEISPAIPASPSQFNAKYTFDSFITGSCNQLAYAAAINIAQNPGHSYNPLFIYGGSGLGKTHLLHAIGHATLASNLRVLYVSAEQFTNEFINALRERKMDDFHNKYRNVDMLLIDDIHFITGKEQTEESFFHTFNELHLANRQIAITCDRPPQSLPLLESRLHSRFEWGLIADIQPPDFETSLAILKAKAEHKGADIALEVLELIASQNHQNVRQLEGALNRVIAYAAIINAPLTSETVTQVLEDIGLKKPKKAPLTPNLIIEAVAQSFQLPPSDLRSKKRDKETTLARHLAMYLIRKETACSLAQIGRELGDRDHSTVTHACGSIASGIEGSPYLKRKITDILQSMHNGLRNRK